MNEGTRVIHVTDPHGRNEGVITEARKFRAAWGLVKVRWISGVTETLHVSELREKKEQ